MSDNKWDLIFRSWLKLFKKHGPKKVSIDMIVNEAWVAKWTFYNYYENKIDLYETIIDDIIDKGKGYLSNLVKNYPEPKERLMIDFLNSLDFFCGKDSIIRNLMEENKDYHIGKISLEYLEEVHKEMISILFQDIIDDVFDESEILLAFSHDLFWFYKHAQHYRTWYKTDEEFRDFMTRLAYFFIEWLFSDYFQDLKNIEYKNYKPKLDEFEQCKVLLKDY